MTIEEALQAVCQARVGWPQNEYARQELASELLQKLREFQQAGLIEMQPRLVVAIRNYTREEIEDAPWHERQRMRSTLNVWIGDEDSDVRPEWTRDEGCARRTIS